MSTRWRVALVVSLALNLFALGALSTAWLGPRPWGRVLREGRRPSVVGMPNPRQLRAALPERDRPLIADALRAHGPEIRQRIRDLAAARADVAEAIRAEPFDRGRLEAAMATLRERETAVATVTQGMVVDLVSRLDAEGRARVADLVPARRARPAREP